MGNYSNWISSIDVHTYVHQYLSLQIWCVYLLHHGIMISQWHRYPQTEVDTYHIWICIHTHTYIYIYMPNWLWIDDCIWIGVWVLILTHIFVLIYRYNRICSYSIPFRYSTVQQCEDAIRVRLVDIMGNQLNHTWRHAMGIGWKRGRIHCNEMIGTIISILQSQIRSR